MRGSDLRELMAEIENTFAALVGAEPTWIRIVDGKPLEVSNVSEDRDAGYKRSAGGMHKRYKFPAIWSAGPSRCCKPPAAKPGTVSAAKSSGISPAW
jgi:hypothetical protein